MLSGFILLSTRHWPLATIKDVWEEEDNYKDKGAKLSPWFRRPSALALSYSNYSPRTFCRLLSYRLRFPRIQLSSSN